MNRIFLITGCSSGIGRRMAQDLASAGHTVYAGVRNIDCLKSIQSNSLRPLVLDVNKAEQVASAIVEIERQSGRLDVLVNNAGYGAMGPVAEVPVEQMREQFETNVFAPIALTQKALPLMRKSSVALVVNIGSATGYFTVPFSGVYNSSKAALHALSDVLRMELAHSGVHVMTVYPGGVASEFGDNAARKLQDTLMSDSHYLAAADDIEKRARVSASSPTTPEDFSRRLIRAMLKKHPPAQIAIGHGSRAMRVIGILFPTAWREYVMRKAYGLTSLA